MYNLQLRFLYNSKIFHSRVSYLIVKSLFLYGTYLELQERISHSFEIVFDNLFLSFQSQIITSLNDVLVISFTTAFLIIMDIIMDRIL